MLRSQAGLGPDLVIPRCRVVGDCRVLRPIGTIDSASVWRFREAIAELPGACRVVLDLSAVSFIDSAGLGALVGGIRRVREMGGDLDVASPRSSISRVFTATGLDRIANVHRSVEDAIAAHRQGGGDTGQLRH